MTLLRDASRQRVNGDGHRARRGFSLPELLVCVGVVGVLASIAVPALSGSRKRAESVSGLSQIRQNGVLIGSYCATYDGVYPIADRNPWINSTSWTLALQRGGVLDAPASVTRIGAAGAGPTDAVISVCMSYAPEMMTLGHTVPDTESVVSPIRDSMVASPGAKGLMYDSEIETASGSCSWCCATIVEGPVLFADGSATLGSWPMFLPSGFHQVQDRVGNPVFSTWNGVRGRDR